MNLQVDLHAPPHPKHGLGFTYVSSGRRIHQADCPCCDHATTSRVFIACRHPGHGAAFRWELTPEEAREVMHGIAACLADCEAREAKEREAAKVAEAAALALIEGP